MQHQKWIYILGAGDASATNPYNVLYGGPPITTLGASYANGAVSTAGSVEQGYSKVADLVAVMSYEAGHAEDPQLDTIEYFGTDLQYGAMIALDLLSEGKSLLNNERVQQELGA